jgi:L-rhamnose mutarotase
MMTRQSFKMFLKPLFEVEYAKRHNSIWSELKALLKETGVNYYSPSSGIEKQISFLQFKRSREVKIHKIWDQILSFKNGGRIWQKLWKQIQPISWLLFHSRNSFI